MHICDDFNRILLTDSYQIGFARLLGTTQHVKQTVNSFINTRADLNKCWSVNNPIVPMGLAATTP